MPGFVPAEGRTMHLEQHLKRDLTDRDANLQLALFTNVAPGAAITAAALTRPPGVADISLNDASWVVVGAQGTYAQQRFSFTGAATGVQGYALVTLAAGGTPRIAHIEVDAAGPHDFDNGDTYDIDLTVDDTSPAS